MSSVEENRSRFIRELRVNSRNLKQHYNCTLYDPDTGSVCALGLGCFEFGVDVQRFIDGEEDADPYSDMKELLGMDSNTTIQITCWNDLDYLTFRQIADKLEERWFSQHAESPLLQADDLEEIR